VTVKEGDGSEEGHTCTKAQSQFWMETVEARGMARNMGKQLSSVAAPFTKLSLPL